MLGAEQDCYGGCTDAGQGFYGLLDEVSPAAFLFLCLAPASMYILHSWPEQPCHCCCQSSTAVLRVLCNAHTGIALASCARYTCDRNWAIPTW